MDPYFIYGWKHLTSANGSIFWLFLNGLASSSRYVSSTCHPILSHDNVDLAHSRVLGMHRSYRRRFSYKLQIN